MVNKPELRPTLMSHIAPHKLSSPLFVNVDRLLVRRAPIATNTLQQFGWAPALIQLLRVLFRGMLETVRDTVFSEPGAKQFQIDISWLRDAVNERLVTTRRTSNDSQLHLFGYTVPQRQLQTEESQFRLISILTDDMIVSAATPPIQQSDVVECFLGRLVPAEELDRIIMHEVPIEGGANRII